MLVVAWASANPYVPANVFIRLLVLRWPNMDAKATSYAKAQRPFFGSILLRLSAQIARRILSLASQAHMLVLPTPALLLLSVCNSRMFPKSTPVMTLVA